jgi:hypothetical protein
MRPFNDDRGGVAYDPVIILDNGTKLWFVTQETETGEYGHSIGIGRPNRRKRSAQ